MIRVLLAFRKLLCARGYGINEVMNRIMSDSFYNPMKAALAELGSKIEFREADLDDVENEMKDVREDLRSDDSELQKDAKDREHKLKKLENEIRSDIKDMKHDSALIKQNLDGLQDLAKSSWFDDKVYYAAKYWQENMVAKGSNVKLHDDAVDDIIADFAKWLIQNSGVWLRSFASKHKNDDYTTVTSDDVKAMFTYFVNKKVQTIAYYTLKNRKNEYQFDIRENEDGEMSQQDLVEAPPAEKNPLEDEEIATLKQELNSFIEKKSDRGKNGILYAIMQEWWKWIGNHKDESSIIKSILKSPEVRAIKSEVTGQPYSEKQIQKYYQYIKYQIIWWFIHVKNIELSDRELRMLNVDGQVRRTASRTIQRKLYAEYVLAGVNLDYYRFFGKTFEIEDRVATSFLNEE